MNNIFENANFGDIYVSNDGAKHTFCSFTTSGYDTLARLYREGWGVVISYLDGTVHSGIERSEPFAIKEQDALKLFASLPHLNEEYKVVKDLGYTPSLYHFEAQWFVDWIHCSEGDSLFHYAGKTPEEAIMKAYAHYQEHINKQKKQ